MKTKATYLASRERVGSKNMRREEMKFEYEILLQSIMLDSYFFLSVKSNSVPGPAIFVKCKKDKSFIMM